MAGSGLFLSMLKKLSLFDRPNNIGAINLKMDGSFSRKNNLLRCLGCLFLLNWIVSLILSLTIKKSSSKKIGPLICLSSFLLLRLLHKYITRPCMEYCCKVLTGAPDCCWEILDKLQVCRTLAYRRNVASLRTYFFG